MKQQTFVAAVALLSMLFLSVMTAESGKYWGNNEVDSYIIKITEGKEQSYLDMKTPTAMTVRAIGEQIYVCENDKCPEREVCTVAENGYVITEGRKVAKAAFLECSMQ